MRLTTQPDGTLLAEGVVALGRQVTAGDCLRVTVSPCRGERAHVRIEIGAALAEAIRLDRAARSARKRREADGEAFSDREITDMHLDSLGCEDGC